MRTGAFQIAYDASTERDESDAASAVGGKRDAYAEDEDLYACRVGAVLPREEWLIIDEGAASACPVPCPVPCPVSCPVPTTHPECARGVGGEVLPVLAASGC